MRPRLFPPRATVSALVHLRFPLHIFLAFLLVSPSLAGPAEDFVRAINDGKKAFAQQNYADAEKHFQAALTVAETFGGKDVRLAEALDHLGTVYSRQTQYAKAEPLFKRAISVIEAARDTGHSDLVMTLQNLAMLNIAQKKYDEAEALLLRTKAILEASFGKDDERVATALNNLAAIEGMRGQYGKAVKLLQESLVIREKAAAGADSDIVAATLTDLGKANIGARQPQEAEKHYRRAVEILRKTQAKKPPLADAINRLARLYDEQKKFADSAPLYEEVLKMLEEQVGPDHAAVGQTAYNLANAQGELGKHDAAEVLLKRALAIAEKTAAGKDDAEVGKVNFTLGRLYLVMKKYKEAEQPCSKAVTIFQKTVGVKHPFYAIAVLNYAAVLENTGRKEEANRLRQAVAALRQQPAK